VGLKDCPETPVNNYQSTSRNVAEERRSQGVSFLMLYRLSLTRKLQKQKNKKTVAGRPMISTYMTTITTNTFTITTGCHDNSDCLQACETLKVRQD
jgi:hypothetical protein